MKFPSYSPDQLKTWKRAQLEILRDNAKRLGRNDVERMCAEELASRRPSGGKRAFAGARNRNDGVVAGYHFVCSRDRGVTDAGNGRFWTGSWVVAEKHVQRSLEVGAYVALHETKNTPSYRSGKMVGYRKSPRHIIGKDNDGIEFLVESTPGSKTWVGDSAGEKGYSWVSDNVTN